MKHITVTKDDIIEMVKEEVLKEFGTISGHYETFGIVSSAVDRYMRGPHMEVTELPAIKTPLTRHTHNLTDLQAGDMVRVEEKGEHSIHDGKYNGYEGMVLSASGTLVSVRIDSDYLLGVQSFDHLSLVKVYGHEEYLKEGGMPG